jgi:histidinol-phosphate aminotransferase
MIRLHLNENPFSLPKKIRREISFGLKNINEYPTGIEDEIIQKISKNFRVKNSNIILTQGIDEAIDRLIGQFKKMRFVIFVPTFDGYISRLEANTQKHKVLKLDQSFRIKEADIQRITKNDFVIIANPNNPTGNLFEDSIDKIKARCGKLLIDETYFDFSNGKSYLKECGGNLFVFRSFSKAYAAAGLRLGWLYGNKQDVLLMKNRQWFCNINYISLTILNYILESDYPKNYAIKILKEKERIFQSISKLGFDVKKTKTNFLLMRYNPARLLIDYLSKKGILVKDLSSLGLNNFIRISIGSLSNNDKLLRTLKQFNYEKK